MRSGTDDDLFENMEIEYKPGDTVPVSSALYRVVHHEAAERERFPVGFSETLGCNLSPIVEGVEIEDLRRPTRAEFCQTFEGYIGLQLI
jgi:hypothetical protein